MSVIVKLFTVTNQRTYHEGKTEFFGFVFIPFDFCFVLFLFVLFFCFFPYFLKS